MVLHALEGGLSFCNSVPFMLHHALEGFALVDLGSTQWLFMLLRAPESWSVFLLMFLLCFPFYLL